MAISLDDCGTEKIVWYFTLHLAAGAAGEDRKTFSDEGWVEVLMHLHCKDKEAQNHVCFSSG